MRPDERVSLRQAYGFRCGYCGVAETDVGAELTVDHFQPVSRGGSNLPSNLVYACHPCNEFKGDYWNPNSTESILHPLFDPLAEHLTEAEDGTLASLTSTGTFHIQRLRLNRPLLVQHRLELRRRELEQLRMQELLRRLEQLETRVQSLTSELQQEG